MGASDGAAPDPRKDRSAALKEALARSLLVADGSTGSALAALAPEAGDRQQLFALERPELLASLHRSYFEAGSDLVETATFQASARGLERFAAGPGSASEIAYRVNLAAARIACLEAIAAEAATGKARWVAGSMGPGGESPSLGFSSWEELKASYLPQARGLADGGCDLALVETCQDPIQAKAAIAALLDPAGGRGLPFIVSATVDARGRLLTGSSIEAFAAVFAPFHPLALGLNCSGGPDELEAPLARLADVSPLPLSFMPNAGLPREVDGRASWPLGPSEFAQRVNALARRHGIAVAGGCCGTVPEHISALSRLLDDRPRLPPRPQARPALASLYEALPLGACLAKMGGAADTAKNAAFASLVDSGDWDEMAAFVVAQEDEGAICLSLRVDRPRRDEAADLAALVSRLSGLSRAALCLCSRDPAALAAALPCAGGRALILLESLEDAAFSRELLAVAAGSGAAILCTARDEAGSHRGFLHLATGDFGFDPASIIFDLEVSKLPARS